MTFARCFSSLFVLLLTFGVDRALGQQVGDELACLVEIGRIVEEAIEAGELPGCVIGVWHDGDWKLRLAYGDRAIEPQRERMTLDTIFDMASLTKPIATATSVMLLVEQGKIDLDAPVSRYLPEFSGAGRDEVLVKHLLLHTSGLIADNTLADYQNGIEESWQRLFSAKMVQSPGRDYVYSDVGYMLLGRIVEVVSGSGLNTFADENIFRRLAMRDTGFVPAEELRSRIAPTEKRDGMMLRGEVHDPRAALLHGVAGHAGLFSTLDDVGAYAQMLLANGKSLTNTRLLRPETVWRMTQPHVVGSRDNFGQVLRTYGWDQHSPFSYNGGNLLGPFAFGHGGFTGTVLWIDPDQNLFYVFLSNRLHPDGKGNVNRLAGKIADLVLREVLALPPDDSKSVPHNSLLKKGSDPLGGEGQTPFSTASGSSWYRRPGSARLS